MNLRAEEERCSRLKEETLTLREELAKAQLAKDLLEQQKSETDSLLNHIDKTRGILLFVLVVFSFCHKIDLIFKSD